MPKRSKRARHCISAVKKRWDDIKCNKRPSDDLSTSGESDFSALWASGENDFDALWTSGENEPLDDNQFVEEFEQLKPDWFEKLLKAKQPDTKE